jgi:SmpA / OmlA family
MRKWLLLSVCLVFSCGKPLPDLSPIDLAQWKEDKGGCKQIRSAFLSDLTNQKDELKGLSEGDIIKLLGRPDRNELYKRNQKFYYYDLEPGKACDSTLTNQQLIVRFNAMGMAKEVAIETIH